MVLPHPNDAEGFSLDRANAEKPFFLASRRRYGEQRTAIKQAVSHAEFPRYIIPTVETNET
jgi:hypothetical protein